MNRHPPPFRALATLVDDHEPLAGELKVVFLTAPMREMAIAGIPRRGAQIMEDRSFDAIDPEDLRWPSIAHALRNALEPLPPIAGDLIARHTGNTLDGHNAALTRPLDEGVDVLRGIARIYAQRHRAQG